MVPRVVHVVAVFGSLRRTGRVSKEEVRERVAGVAVVGEAEVRTSLEQQREELEPEVVARLEEMGPLGPAHVVLDLPVAFRHRTVVAAVAERQEIGDADTGTPNVSTVLFGKFLIPRVLGKSAPTGEVWNPGKYGR